jgi:palmitoyltransferase ZDHHC9/14/18
VCAKIEPSKHKFRAHIQEEVRAPPANRAGETEEEQVGGPRAKVGDGLDIDGDLMKISHRHNHEDVDIEIGCGDANEVECSVSDSKVKDNTDAHM